MKRKVTLLTIALCTGFLFSVQAQNTGTGVAWGTLGFAENLVLNEDFSGFAFFHTDENPDQGNSDNTLANDGITINYGYKNDSVAKTIPGTTQKVIYKFNQCAFAPEWQTAYAFSGKGEQTAGVSNGFVEISREYSASGSNLATVHGSFVVDLRALDFVEGIQWSHSSTGGNKRGVMCEISLDNGTTWDTLRYQNGVTWALNFTKDPVSGLKEMNTYRCDPSALGMTWEDGIFTNNVMLRFGECGGQTPRIHDLKVYGTIPTAAHVINKDDLKIFAFNKKIKISEQVDVAVYNISGVMVRRASQTNTVSMDDMPNGIYIVKAQSGNRFRTGKVLIH